MKVEKPIRVYLGGKIASYDWRHSLFSPGIFATPHNAEMILHESRLDNTPVNIEGINLQYAGPYFMACDHGCYHYGQSHALGATWKWERDDWINSAFVGGCSGEDTLTRQDAINICETWLDGSDVMVVWASDDFHTAHGTHVEMGYARAKKIPILLMIDSKLKPEYVRQWWFAAESASNHIFADDPVTGFQELCTNKYMVI